MIRSPPLQLRISTDEMHGASLHGIPLLYGANDNPLPLNTQVSYLSEDLYGQVKTGKYSKVGTVLANLVDQVTKESNERATAFAAAGEEGEMNGNNNNGDRSKKVFVNVVGKDATTDLYNALVAKSMDVAACYQLVCSVLCPVMRLVKLANMDQVQFVRPSMHSTNAGSVTSQGVQAIRADSATKNLTVDGTGILVCVVSDSYDCLGTAAQDVESGDLPSNVLSMDLSPELCEITGTDEGRAMLQIVHDVAPGASLAFHTGLISFPGAVMQLLD